MNIKEIIKKLDIGPVGLGWSYFKDGWAGIAKYLCEKLSAMLKKLPAEQLKQYSDIIKDVAKILGTAVDTFVKNVSVKLAANATVELIGDLASHIEDGEYTKKELDDDINVIKVCIDNWKEVSK